MCVCVCVCVCLKRRSIGRSLILIAPISPSAIITTIITPSSPHRVFIHSHICPKTYMHPRLPPTLQLCKPNTHPHSLGSSFTRLSTHAFTCPLLRPPHTYTHTCSPLCRKTARAGGDHPARGRGTGAGVAAAFGAHLQGGKGRLANALARPVRRARGRFNRGSHPRGSATDAVHAVLRIEGARVEAPGA